MYAHDAAQLDGGGRDPRESPEGRGDKLTG
jgi:hypothetical protein